MKPETILDPNDQRYFALATIISSVWKKEVIDVSDTEIQDLWSHIKEYMP